MYDYWKVTQYIKEENKLDLKEYNLAQKGKGQLKKLLYLLKCLLFKSDTTTEEEEKNDCGSLFFGSQRSLLGLFSTRKWVSFSKL